MGFLIVPFEGRHLDDSAQLVTERYRLLRILVPELPQRYEDAESILPLLRELAGRSPGVVAIDGKRLVGFLIGRVIPSFRGKRAAYCPEWAHAAHRDDSREIYQRMYAALSVDWIGDKCVSHLITLFAGDRAAIDAWFWEGFGLTAADAMRDLSHAEGATTDIEICQAEAADVDDLVTLGEGLRHHLRSAPTFLADASNPDRASWDEQVRDPEVCIQVARHAAAPVACMRVEGANPTACYIIRDERTASVTGAFAEPEARGRGVGTALLNRCVEWARSAGYERLAVDFEPMNVAGSRFWLRHFQPVCLSAMRIVDERAAV